MKSSLGILSAHLAIFHSLSIVYTSRRVVGGEEELRVGISFLSMTWKCRRQRSSNRAERSERIKGKFYFSRRKTQQFICMTIRQHLRARVCHCCAAETWSRACRFFFIGWHLYSWSKSSRAHTAQINREGKIFWSHWRLYMGMSAIRSHHHHGKKVLLAINFGAFVRFTIRFRLGMAHMTQRGIR